MPSSKSPLAPIDPAVAEAGAHQEQEHKKGFWKREAASTLTGRFLRSSYETLRSAGTSVTCLSPWGDSSPLILPSIRWRDLVIETVLVTSGGTAAVAAPVDVGAVGADATSSAVAELVSTAVTEASDAIFVEEPIEIIADKIQKHDYVTTDLKIVRIILTHKNTQSDASIGYFKSSFHEDMSLFSSVKDFISVEKGWFSPYLFASSRRPAIPRKVTPDVIFCHGPFMKGDYEVGQALLSNSWTHISFCKAPPPTTNEGDSTSSSKHSKMGGLFKGKRAKENEGSASGATAPGDETESSLHRRMAVFLVGILPHKGNIWTTSGRPGESIIRYILMNGSSAIVLPTRVGAPLLAWSATSLSSLWKFQDPDSPNSAKYIDGLLEYLDMCVDWERVRLNGKEKVKAEKARSALRDALRILVGAAIECQNCNEVKKLDADRAGIAMWRIP
ncbi:hypothetical protein DL96DRAFT_1571580 [Flagelloscypha sp. PMI_526]|nr:hypothetical protein DL96DRAFT_1571580 [Flagelloscypha sp. PMI_526]